MQSLKPTTTRMTRSTQGKPQKLPAMTDEQNVAYERCRKHRPYLTISDADLAIARKQSAPDYYVKPGYTLHWYLCCECYRYHVGNTRIWAATQPKKDEPT